MPAGRARRGAKRQSAAHARGPRRSASIARRCARRASRCAGRRRRRTSRSTGELVRVGARNETTVMSRRSASGTQCSLNWPFVSCTFKITCSTEGRIAPPVIPALVLVVLVCSSPARLPWRRLGWIAARVRPAAAGEQTSHRGERASVTHRRAEGAPHDEPESLGGDRRVLRDPGSRQVVGCARRGRCARNHGPFGGRAAVVRVSLHSPGRAGFSGSCGWPPSRRSRIPCPRERLAIAVARSGQSMGDFVHRAQNWLVVRALFRRSRRRSGVHLFDQGVVQELCSIGYRGDWRAPSRVPRRGLMIWRRI